MREGKERWVVERKLNSAFIFRRAILTDKFLRVKGAEGVFALGDCSTIEQELLISRAKELFKMADINHDGTLTLNEFQVIIEKAKAQFPQVQVQLSYVEDDVDKYVGPKAGHTSPSALCFTFSSTTPFLSCFAPFRVFPSPFPLLLHNFCCLLSPVLFVALFLSAISITLVPFLPSPFLPLRLFESTDTSGDQKLDYGEFVVILKKMDRNLKNLPATAQVASQQVHIMREYVMA